MWGQKIVSGKGAGKNVYIKFIFTCVFCLIYWSEKGTILVTTSTIWHLAILLGIRIFSFLPSYLFYFGIELPLSFNLILFVPTIPSLCHLYIRWKFLYLEYFWGEINVSLKVMGFGISLLYIYMGWLTPLGVSFHSHSTNLSIIGLVLCLIT